MSAYITLATPMTDRQCLLDALADLEFGSNKVEVHEDAVPLVGYRGRRRSQQANIIIRRQHVGGSSNDVGFLETETGYRAYVSGFDHPRFGTEWLSKIHERYQIHWSVKQERLAEEERRQQEEARKRLVEAQRLAVHERAKKLGYRVKESKEGETVRLVLVKRTY